MPHIAHLGVGLATCEWPIPPKAKISSHRSVATYVVLEYVPSPQECRMMHITQYRSVFSHHFSDMNSPWLINRTIQ